MSLKFHWFLPTYGDSRFIVGGGHGVPAGVAGGARPATIAYLGQIARSAEQIGFEAALTPTGAWCEDAWLMTAMLNEVSESLKFLVAFRPGLMSPTLAAQMAATFQNSSQGRLLLNIVVGGERHEQRAYGDFLEKDDRYARADEWLTVVERLWAGERVTYAGKHVRVEDAHIPRLPEPLPPFYFGGSSAAAGAVAATHTDVYLTWGEPVEAVAEKIGWIRGLAEAQGRKVRFGIRLHVIARDTAEAAWAEAQRLLDAIDPETVAQVQAGLARSQSEGQQRMRALHGGSKDNLVVGPNLWAGVGLVRGGAGTALVGSHSEIAERIKDYAAVGIEEFVLSGVPHLEEAYWFGEGVLPILKRDGLWRHPQGNGPAVSATVPFAPVGEPVAKLVARAE
ncbi:MAG: LLM class flavin-dependent oxidoreductase [Novosphingobium sp.]